MATASRRLPLLRPLSAAACALLAACGGGGKSNPTSVDQPELPSVQQGIFRDSPVTGLSYVSGSESGVTDAEGRFTCATGQDVAFSIGSLSLGQMPCATLAHPPALTSSGSFVDPRALNISRLLLVLDSDGDPTNGVGISEGLRSVAASWAPVDFAAADFPAELAQVISDVFSVDGRVIAVPPTSNEAYAHMEPRLACAYSGVFGGVLRTSANSGVGQAVVLVYRNPASGTDAFALMPYGSRDYLFAPITGFVTLGTRPTLTSTGDANVPSFDGAYATPDTISGQWVNPANDTGKNGTLSARRIGPVSGEYKFVGEYGANRDFGGLSVVWSGDSLSGEVYRTTNGEHLALTGVRVAGDEFELHLESVEETATAILMRDAAGEPVSLVGGWPGAYNGAFQAYGCRL